MQTESVDDRLPGQSSDSTAAYGSDSQEVWECENGAFESAVSFDCYDNLSLAQDTILSISCFHCGRTKNVGFPASCNGGLFLEIAFFSFFESMVLYSPSSAVFSILDYYGWEHTFDLYTLFGFINKYHSSLRNNAVFIMRFSNDPIKQRITVYDFSKNFVEHLKKSESSMIENRSNDSNDNSENSVDVTLEMRLTKLKTDFVGLRSISGDGNCYFRSVLIAHIETCVRRSIVDRLNPYHDRRELRMLAAWFSFLTPCFQTAFERTQHVKLLDLLMDAASKYHFLQFPTGSFPLSSYLLVSAS